MGSKHVRSGRSRLAAVHRNAHQTAPIRRTATEVLREFGRRHGGLQRIDSSGLTQGVADSFFLKGGLRLPLGAPDRRDKSASAEGLTVCRLRSVVWPAVVNN